MGDHRDEADEIKQERPSEQSLLATAGETGHEGVSVGRDLQAMWELELHPSAAEGA